MKYSIAIVGLGHWGKKLFREFNALTNISYAFGKKDSQLSKALKDPIVDAVVIATPIKTHFAIASRALLAGKHVFLEKPMTDNVVQARILVALAQKQQRALFIGHTFLYHPVFKKIEQINKKDPIVFINFDWQKFGSFNEDIKWNLLVHEVALLLKLWGKPSQSKLLYTKGIVSDNDIVSAQFLFSKQRKANVYINRTSSIKRKAITLITKNKNVYLWENNDLFKLNKNMGSFKLLFKSKLAALTIECRSFLKTINKKPDGLFELNVIKILNGLKN